MRPPAELAFILARTRAWMAENPPRGPLLEEAPVRTRTPRKAACARGHVNPERFKDGRCRPCDREWQRARRGVS
jgi:hypothetical protein